MEQVVTLKYHDLIPNDSMLFNHLKRYFLLKTQIIPFKTWNKWKSSNINNSGSSQQYS